MIPKSVARSHVLAALARISREGVPPGRTSRGYDLDHDGKRYPPKYALTLAIDEAGEKRPSPDDLGGGEETNTFLRGLGFTVVTKGTAPAAPPVSAVPSGPTSIRVGRVFLNAGIRQSERQSTSFEALTRAQFTADPAAYRARLVRLIERARGDGAEVVVLPAGAFILSKATPLSAYAVPDVPLVVAGGADPNGEFAVVMRHGVAGERFDPRHVHWLDAGRFTVLTAISSTIGKVIRNGRHEEPVLSKLAPPDPARPILVVDVGHHQYGSRYHFNTLRCVARDAARPGKPAALVLSSWMWSSKGIACSWCQPEDRVTVRTLTEPQERDRLDLIDVDLGAAAKGPPR